MRSDSIKNHEKKCQAERREAEDSGRACPSHTSHTDSDVDLLCQPFGTDLLSYPTLISPNKCQTDRYFCFYYALKVISVYSSSNSIEKVQDVET